MNFFNIIISWALCLVCMGPVLAKSLILDPSSALANSTSILLSGLVAESGAFGLLGHAVQQQLQGANYGELNISHGILEASNLFSTVCTSKSAPTFFVERLQTEMTKWSAESQSLFQKLRDGRLAPQEFIAVFDELRSRPDVKIPWHPAVGMEPSRKDSRGPKYMHSLERKDAPPPSYPIVSSSTPPSYPIASPSTPPSYPIVSSSPPPSFATATYILPVVTITVTPSATATWIPIVTITPLATSTDIDIEIELPTSTSTTWIINTVYVGRPARILHDATCETTYAGWVDKFEIRGQNDLAPKMGPDMENLRFELQSCGVLKQWNVEYTPNDPLMDWRVWGQISVAIPGCVGTSFVRAGASNRGNCE